MQWFTKYYGRESALSNHIKTGKEEEKKSEPAIRKNPLVGLNEPKKCSKQITSCVKLLVLLISFKYLRACAQIKYAIAPVQLSSSERAIYLITLLKLRKSSSNQNDLLLFFPIRNDMIPKKGLELCRIQPSI